MVTRFMPATFCVSYDAVMVQRNDGKYVLYEEYEKLQALLKIKDQTTNQEDKIICQQIFTKTQGQGRRQ